MRFIELIEALAVLAVPELARTRQLERANRVR
jgi:hypothetical protein